MKIKKAGLKITGIVLGMIAGVTALSIIFSITLLPVMKYNTAVKNAESGNYTLAVKGLMELKSEYKDSEKKKQEYALEAGKAFLSEGNRDEALKYLDFARVYAVDKTVAEKAQRLYDENKLK